MHARNIWSILWTQCKPGVRTAESEIKEQGEEEEEKKQKDKEKSQEDKDNKVCQQFLIYLLSVDLLILHSS